MRPCLLGLVVMLALAPVGRRAHAAPTCDDLDAIDGAVEDEASGWARAIWQGVLGAHARLDPAATVPSLRVVGNGGGGLPAGAWYCRGADTVHVSRALVDYAWIGRGSDGTDLLAFALAHELAHRRFDEGDARLAAGACPEADPAVEARADRRAALLVALAIDPTTGRAHAPATLVRRAALEAFFVAELGWDPACPALAERVRGVEAALARLDDLARAWDVALTLVAAAGAGSDAATATLAALHDAAGGPGPDGAWDALPELGLLRAQAHIQRAGEAGWCPAGLARDGLAPDPCTLACTIVSPGRARVAPTLSGEPRRAGVEPAMELALARLLVEGARKQGVPAADLAGAEACLAYLERDPARALAALDRIGPGATPRVRAALRDDRRLFELQRDLLAGARPSDEGRAWLAQRVVPAPIAAVGPLAAAPSPVPLRCADVPDRSTTLGPVSVAFAGACTTIEAGRARAELDVHLPDAASRSLAPWAAACRLGTPLVDVTGRERGAARCDGALWVLEREGESVTRATRIRTRP